MAYYRPPSRRSRVSRKSSLTEMLIVSKLLKYAIFGLVGLVVLFFVYFLWVSRDLPAPGKLSNPDIHDSTRILDKNGTILYSIYKNYNRLYIPLSQIPRNIQNATIATEDKNFYKESGFDPLAYLRVAKDILFRQEVTGGSTITQQLVKNLLLTNEYSLSRKVKELILAVQVDQKYTKAQILEMYLNNIPYGASAVGVEAGATLYFNKHAKDLDLAQSAFLAGLPQSPSRYSPYVFGAQNKAWLARSKDVLGRMVTEGYITQKQSDAALKEISGFTFSAQQANLKAPHFIQYIRKQLNDMFGEQLVDQGDLTIKTTLDYTIEQKAEDIVNTEIASLKIYRVGNGAAIVMNPKTGAILAMVGSHNYFDNANQGQFNAALASRQPGSSLKPVMYATALEKGYTAASVLMDTKTDFTTGTNNDPVYTPVNYDGKFSGPMQMRFALGNSKNIPAVKMLAMVGIKPVMQKAYDMGIDSWQPTAENLKNVGWSLVLGGREATLLQEVTAYSVFANQGKRNDSYGIEEVDDSHGKVIYRHQQHEPVQVLSPEVSFIISHMLLDNNARQAEFGVYSALVVPGKTVSVKTGTTDAKRDNWTIGYTPSYTVGVWVGNNDNTPMNEKIASGITGATPIWNKIMQAVLKGKADEQPVKPDTVIAAQIDSFAGGIPIDGKPTRSEYFLKGTEPTAPSPIYQKIKVSKSDSNRLASDDDISKNNYDTKDFIVLKESDPVSQDGKNRWQEGIDAWIKATYASDHPEYYPPTLQVGQSASPTPSPTP